MFYYKLFTPLCNCFLFPCSHFKHLKIYHLIFSIGITSLTFYFFYWNTSTFFTGCTMPLRLRSPLHRAAIHVFPAATHKGRHISSVDIPASLPPRFPHTVAYGMCSVPPHIPYPAASLRERSYASAASLPLPAATTFLFPFPLHFLKIFFPMR